MERVALILDDITDWLIMLACLICASIGLYFIVDSNFVYSHTAGPQILPTQMKPAVVEEAMKELSEDAIAWLEIDDTTINYPIMHCDNNNKYLNTDAYGNYSTAGAIFLDCRNSPDFSDKYSIVYGHHMAKDYMFGALDRFIDPDYLDSHRTGRLVCGDHTYRLNIFAFAVLDAMDDIIFDPTVDPDYMHDHFYYRALLYRENSGGPILAFSTCRDPGFTVRTMVICEILPDQERELSD